MASESKSDVSNHGTTTESHCHAVVLTMGNTSQQRRTAMKYSGGGRNAYVIKMNQIYSRSECVLWKGKRVGDGEGWG